MKILLDSTVLIDVERKNEAAIELVESLALNKEELLVSTVTAAEILTGVYFLSMPEGISEAGKLLAQFSLVPLDMDVADKIAHYLAFLLRNGTPIDFKDVAIAATFATTKSDFLITGNKKRFEAIPDIGSKARTVSEFRKIYK